MAWRVDDSEVNNEALMVHELAHQLRKSFDRRAQHLGLTRSQWRVLAIVRRNQGIRQSQLADKMEVEPITLVRLLDRMVKSGWIERKPDPYDRRANQVYLTDKVKYIVGEMSNVALDLRQDVLVGFSEAEHKQLVAYLTRMKSNMLTMEEL